MIRFVPFDPAEFDGLMAPEAYEEFISEE